MGKKYLIQKTFINTSKGRKPNKHSDSFFDSNQKLANFFSYLIAI